MNKIMGILLLLVYICAASALLSDRFATPYNMQNVFRYTALYGIVGIGVSFVIITGGIDLSIGSMVGLTGCILPMLLVDKGWSIPMALLTVMGISLGLGLAHGLLITRLNLQPFIVTLCGLLVYRGVARGITNDQTQGFGQEFDSLRLLAQGKPCSMATLILLAGVLLAVWAVWRTWSLRRDEFADGHSKALAVTSLVMGIVLAVIGASRFSAGMTWEGETLTTMAATVPDFAAQRPQHLMRLAGWGMIPAFLWLLAIVARAKPTKLVVPGILLILSALAVAGSTRLTSLPDSAFSPSAAWAGTQRMSAVFLSLGALMASIGWFSQRSIAVAGRAVLAPLMLTGFFAILWLLGATPLGETLVPAPMLILIGIAVLAATFLNQTIYGRYLLALGRNEEAARYSGIQTDRMIVLAYVLCGAASGICGILFALDSNSIMPSGHGSFLELYAIAAAVLGGCSLRGGEGTIIGVIIGAAVLRVLYNAINILGIPSKHEYAIIGIVILCGVLADELVRRISSRKAGRVAS